MTEILRFMDLINQLIDSQKHIAFVWGNVDEVELAIKEQNKIKGQLIDMFTKAEKK